MENLASNLELIRPGDITIADLLGRGGYGDVSMATRTNWGDVVVKKFSKISLNEQILQEIGKTWRLTSFPYLVNIMGIIDDPGKPLNIVMEYLEYGDLKDFNRKYMMGCNCWPRKIKMIQEISLGMNYLHIQDHPLLHRGLKLEDILVGTGFIVKIGDHGLALNAKTTQEMSGGNELRPHSHSPPEAWTGVSQEPDEFWNIYAFAITLYELLTGKDPWPAHVDSAQVSVTVRDGKRPDLNEIPLDAPTEVTTFMQRCWNGTPSKRPQFQEIQKRVTDIYRSKFKAAIRRADKAIMDMISNEEHKQHNRPVSAAKGDVNNRETRQQQELNITDTNGIRQVTTENSATDIPSDSHFKPAVAHNMREWRLAKQFGKEGDEDGDFRLAESIAVCQHGNIAVVDTRTSSGGKRVYLFNNDGAYKFTLKSQITDPAGKLFLPEDVAVTSQGHLVVADQSKYVKLFQINGSFLRSFCTLTPDDDPDAKVNTMRVAVTPQDDVLVGDVHRRLVTIHSQADGWAPRKVEVPIRPWYLATNKERHIILSDDWERKVIVLSMEGEIVFTIEEFKLDESAGEPYGMVCDNNGDIYIAVMKVSKNNQARQGSGHIHHYDNTGKFLRCIAKYLRHPYGIAMSNGVLYVANKKSVMIYSTE